MTRIAITCNGPGEFAGWVRPLVHALGERDPALAVSLYFVPDDYATGREPDVARRLFPNATIVRPRDYVRFALGGGPAPGRADIVQYLGGDLMHAARVHRRLGGVATTYKFSRPRYRETFARAFAVDAKNRGELEAWRVPADRIETVGNLAIDGAMMEAAGAFADRDDPHSAALGSDGIVMLPGSRRQEVSSGIPFFTAVALRVRERRPDIPLVFAVSPFTTDDEVRRAIESGGNPNFFGVRGTFEQTGDGMAIRPAGTRHAFPVVRSAMQAAARARLVVTIPGTKTVELAALGIPAIVCTPWNAPEVVVINGLLQYIDRVPLVGLPLKRSAVVAVARRFRFYAQPNIDAGRELHAELAGTLTPSRVASVALERYDDVAWRTHTAAALRALYAGHAGAAGRMADALLACAAGAAR
jgi:lipid-A-disaccharide synthase